MELSGVCIIMAKKFIVKFVEEKCHTYEVTADNSDDAETLAELDYYNKDSDKWEGSKHLIKYLGNEPEGNSLISCDEKEE